MDYWLAHFGSSRFYRPMYSSYMCLMFSHMIMFSMVNLDTDCEQVAYKHLMVWTSKSGLGEAEFGEYSYNVLLKTLGFPPSILAGG